MAGQFLKSLIRRTLAEVAKPRPRRRAVGLRQSLEGLESRALLSAVGYEEPPISAEVRIINAQTTAPVEGAAVPRKAAGSAQDTACDQFWISFATDSSLK
ncbi:MAG: hypothetical protein JWM11_2127 [Planctomycetaceae bacterium]|nr:hypothetical protein [Planctomycetaceae bacterium]